MRDFLEAIDPSSLDQGAKHPVIGASKIVWTEGLLLRPQHFQWQDVFHEQRLNASLSALHSFPWGLRSMTVAHADSEFDRFEVMSMDAVLPDGEVIRAPSCAELPAPLPLSGMAPHIDTLVIGITADRWKHEGGNCPGTLQGDTRYRPAEVMSPDLYTHASPVPVHVARLQTRFMIVGDEALNLDILPLARIYRTPSGRFRFDDSFITPGLAACEVPALKHKLDALKKALHGKMSALMSEQSEPLRDSVAFRAGDHATFWLLHTLSAGAASLGHLTTLAVASPERVFHELLTLAGGLLVFSRSMGHADLPVYQHARADACFTALLDIVKKLMDTAIPTRFVLIPLKKERASYFSGTFDSTHLGENTTLYLAVPGSASDHELISAVPRKFKIGASTDVEKAVTSAIPCIPMAYVSHPPPSVPVKPDHLYFSLDGKSAPYARMAESASVAVFVPGGLEELSLELLAVYS